MVKWGWHSDPLFSEYNVPRLAPEDLDRWLAAQQAQGVLLYSGFVDRVFVAQMKLRPDAFSGMTAEFGISMDPRFIGLGHGRRIMRELVRQAFEVRGFASITLEVASYNQRAIHAYQAVGFREAAKRWMAFDSSVDFRRLLADDGYTWLRELVRIDGDTIFAEFVEMRFRRGDFQK